MMNNVILHGPYVSMYIEKYKAQVNHLPMIKILSLDYKKIEE